MNNNKKILIVDDSPIMRSAAKIALRTLPGIHIEEACNGLEALEHLKLKPVDLMLLDLNMPDIQGEEVLKFVRAHKSFHALPVIILTTSSDIHDRASMLTLGASSYLTKPYKPDELLKRVKNILLF
ncbi:MAG: response regulator [Gammaproteobacteria bacterium]|nr:response regulator [Gammaproteobacteria bacterium]